jgi:hypothetical protein
MSVVIINMDIQMPGAEIRGPVQWEGGREEYDHLCERLRHAAHAAGAPLDLTHPELLGIILPAMVEEASADVSKRDAALGLVAWCLSQPVPNYSGTYADYLSQDWTFHIRCRGNQAEMVSTAGAACRPN